MVAKAPFTPLYKWLLRSKSQKCKLISYQASALIITYLTYICYHMAKRPFSVVKSELAPNCNVTKVNNTCFPWKPFDNPEKNKDILGLLDCAFLTSYALAMFVSGYIAEHTNIRIYLSSGMVLTGVFTGLIGSAYYFDIHSIYFFFLMQVLTGITQSTGWPCVVESVGVWFPEGRRGFIMGVWNTHVSVGNIVGSAIAGEFVDTHWGLSFIVPGIIMTCVGILVFFFLIPDPSHVDMDHIRAERNNVGSEILASPDIGRNSSHQSNKEDSAIGIWGALKIPGVVEYSLCLFFAKLVSYTFLFWLPYYIGKIEIAGVRYGPEKAADWSILFDVGGAFGGIFAGILTDVSRKPGIINVIMLFCAAPSLFLFKFHGTETLNLFIFYMILSGFFVNGPYALITTAVSASLGTHECLQGNTKAMAVVTSIIDATGSLGAAIGPLLAGFISSKADWADVFYMLIAADLIAAVFLSRQFATEVKELWVKFYGHRGNGVFLTETINNDSESETDPLMNPAS